MAHISLRTTFRAVATLSLCLPFGLARAQDSGAPETDPPDRAARLSYVQGDVSLQPAGQDEWADAIVNRPLTTGDRLWTDQGARAEIYVGPAAVRLGSNTGFSFLNVDDDTIQMRMTAGVINVNVQPFTDEHLEVDTPNLALSLLQPGNYRVEVNDAGDTTVVKVSEGEAEASGGSRTVIVHAQQAATFRGMEQLNSQFASLGAPDEFDSWSLARERRDQQAESSQTAQYVAPEVTGYQDLNDNGTWSSEPEYGYVWTPTHVAMGWSPYQYGRWAWVAPWGWTWIDDAPWGYAPFHYGRWAHVRERWCWVPGPRHVRAVYAPALVGWVGPPGVSVSLNFGGGGVAWFPLGPREVYVPARRFSPRYVERVNVTNTVIVNRTYINNVYNNRVTNVTYRNRTVPGAVTSVSRTTFTSAERVGNHRVRFDEQQFAHAGATAMAPQIQPGRESRLGVGEMARRTVRVPPQTVANRQVVVKREPPPAAAHFARNAGANNVPRTQTDQPRRPQDRVERGETAHQNRPVGTNVPAEANREAAQAAEHARAREDRPPQARSNVERSPRTEQPPQVDAAPRAVQAPPVQHAAPDQRREDRPPQQQRQAEVPQQQQPQREQHRQPQQQRQEQERATRQREPQQAAAQQVQQRQHDAQRTPAERPHAERPQPEHQNRPEPQKPAENRSQPQKQQEHKERRPEQDDQKT